MIVLTIYKDSPNRYILKISEDSDWKKKVLSADDAEELIKQIRLMVGE